jgi:hypothetical protein
MSWLFSRALVAEYSAATCLDGAPSAPLSVMPTPHKFWRNDKTMEPSKLSQFGLTCAVLTESHGAALLTSYLAAFHAKTYQLPEVASASMAPAPDFGEKWRESLVRYDLVSSTWKTHQCLWVEDLHWSSVILPKWGTTRAGFVYQHPIAERPTNETASGLLPTPTVANSRQADCPSERSRKSPSLVTAAVMWQTPIADDAVSRAQGKWNSRGEPKLSAQVLWPTPTVHGNHNQPGASKNAGWGLSSAVKLWPTPQATDSNKWSNQTLIDRKAKGQQIRLNTAVSPQGGAGGQLNPAWVEWLMGWPIGWTELKPLAMDKFHEWQQQHSPY